MVEALEQALAGSSESSASRDREAQGGLWRRVLVHPVSRPGAGLRQCRQWAAERIAL
jgi:hypothetical protein